METCQAEVATERFTFERTRDWKLIREIMTHPRIFPMLIDDFCPKPEDWKPIESEEIFYLLAKDGEEVLGLWVLFPQNKICWSVHTCLLPSAWGVRAVEAARAAIQWVFANTICVRLVTNVPGYNKLAFRLARNAGMIEYGVNPSSYQKDGKLWTQTLLGISKEKSCQQ